MAGIARQEQTSHIAVVRTTTCLSIKHPCFKILFFQAHVHSKHLVAGKFSAHKLATLAQFVIYSNVLNGIRTKILKQQLMVTTKEVSAVKRQILYKFTIYIYSSAVLQFHSRQLIDKRIKH